MLRNKLKNLIRLTDDYLNESMINLAEHWELMCKQDNIFAQIEQSFDLYHELSEA